MSTTERQAERVEVTPELLEELKRKAQAGGWTRPGGGYEGNAGSAPPAVVLALVERIRELELRLAIANDALSAELRA